jgi:methyl-accepting chemotaxis protein
MKVSIKLKILAGLIVSIFLVFSVIFAITAYDVHRHSRSMAIQGIAKELVHVDNSLTLFMDEARLNTEMMANDKRTEQADQILTNYLSETPVPTNETFPGDELGRELRTFYQLILSSHKAYVDCYIGTRKGGFVIGGNDPMPAGYDPRKRPWYKDAVASPGKSIISKAYRSTNGEAMISTGKAIVHNGVEYGVAAMDISLGQITKQLAEIRMGERGHVMVIQDDGVVIANPGDKETLFKNVAELEDSAYKQFFAQDEGAVDTVLDGLDRVGVVHTSPALGWKFVGVIEKAEIMAPVYNTMTNLAIVFVISLLVICAFVWVFMDMVAVRPLKIVADMLGKIRDGKYDARIDKTRNDEIGQIFEALNDMSGTLESNMLEITAKTEEAENKARAAEQAMQEASEARERAERARAEGMIEAGKQLETVVQEINGITEAINAKAHEISEGTNVQRERIQATATAMEEMNATVLEVARNAGDAAGQGQEAKTKAMNGADVVNQSVKAINSIQAQADQLRTNMDELETQARGIGNIMGVITDIADQTNLLALNAAIEAARAGDAGRGFAVVADEVRKLAEKTMTATKEVGDSIEAIQTAADRNVQAMEQAVSDLSTATDLSNTSGSVLQEIVDGAELSADRIQGIATAAEQQSAASEEINQSIDEINSIAAETEQAALETTQALERLAAQAEELSGMVESLRNA